MTNTSKGSGGSRGASSPGKDTTSIPNTGSTRNSPTRESVSNTVRKGDGTSAPTTGSGTKRGKEK